MNKLLEIFKTRLRLFKITSEKNEKYILDVESEQITEEEYELIKEFMTRKDEENGK